MNQQPPHPGTTTAGDTFQHQSDGSGDYWSHRPENTLPPSCAMGAYMRNRQSIQAGAAAGVAITASAGFPRSCAHR